jgi:hypothetical protein
MGVSFSRLFTILQERPHNGLPPEVVGAEIADPNASFRLVGETRGYKDSGTVNATTSRMWLIRSSLKR